MEIYTMPGHLIRRLNQISTGLFLDRMEQAGLLLTPVQFAALAALRDHAGVDQATVAGLIAYDRATIGKVIDKLVVRDLVARSISKQDRRARSLSLTDAGRDLLNSALPHVRNLQGDILAGLTGAERDRLIALMEKATLAGNDMSRAPLKTRE